MRAVTVDSSPERRLLLTQVAPPDPAPGQLTVAVEAISLNRGEVSGALTSAPNGYRPGWDYSGVVEAAPAGMIYKTGDRVFGLLPGGSWAERVVTTPARVALVPEGVSFAQACALPVAGLTAALALEKAGDLAGRSVLVTGATGGVGLIAVQLAAKAGARVTALVRDAASDEHLRRLGAVIVAPDLAAAERAGPYDLVVEAVGGAVLGGILGMLKGQGRCVLVGDAGGSVTTFDAAAFRRFGATMLYGFFLGDELTRTEPSRPLAVLAAAIASGALDPVVSVERPWEEIDGVARDLLDRRFVGKAVLQLA